MRDKEYIKLFDLVQESDGYQIKDLPFMTTAKETGQNLVCHEEGMSIKVVNNVMTLKGTTLQTVFHYSDGTTSESEDTTITQDSYDQIKTLTSVEIGDCVTSIGGIAFYDCQSLTSVTISDSVTTIDYNAFDNCQSLTSIEIPNSVTSIGDYAFKDCYELASVTIGNSVTSIGYDAFYDCDSLAHVTIPSSVTSIKDGAFAKKAEGESYIDITFMSATPKISLVNGSGNIINLFMSQGYEAIPTIHVPAGKEKDYAKHDAGWMAIAQYIVNYEPETKSTFYYSDGTTSESEDTTITFNSYDGNKTLTSVEIGTCATSIGNNAFYGCNGLTSVTIPDSVTSIGEEAFDICSSLTSVTIPDSVTSIGEEAFYNIDITATFESTTPNIPLVDDEGYVIDIFGGYGHDSVPAEFTIIVPTGCRNNYVNDNVDAGWKALAAYIQEAQ